MWWEIVEKEIEKLLRCGVDTAVLKVPVDVCLQCVKCFYSQEMIRRFGRMAEKSEFGGAGDFGIHL